MQATQWAQLGAAVMQEASAPIMLRSRASDEREGVEPAYSDLSEDLSMDESAISQQRTARPHTVVCADELLTIWPAFLRQPAIA